MPNSRFVFVGVKVFECLVLNNTLIGLQLVMSVLCFWAPDRKFPLENRRGGREGGRRSGRGPDSRVHTQTRGALPLASLTSEGTGTAPQKRGARSFPEPIRKLSLCKFNDGNHGGKTSRIKI